MKRIVALLFLIILPLCASSQQRINRDVAGLTLGRYYRVSKIQDVIFDKFSCLSRNFKESSSNSVMALGSIPFAGEMWDCLNVIQESTGRIGEIAFGKKFKDPHDAVSFCSEMGEMLISKYGSPSITREGLALECVWNDPRNTALQLQAIGKNDSEEPEIVVWLSYTDLSLMQKIQTDTFNEL